MLERLVFEILDTLQPNAFLTEAEIRRAVAERVPHARHDDVARAIGEVNRRFGLAAGWLERGHEIVWGFALRRNITEMAPGVLCIIGARVGGTTLEREPQCTPR